MDALDRMFHVLVRTLRDKHPKLLGAPFTVADLHQQLLPYRHFRRELGLQTNQEYELVLMELLTGARGYLDVDERLRDELGRELLSPGPEPARVRQYAEAQVSVNQKALASVAGKTAPDAPPSQPVRAASPDDSVSGAKSASMTAAAASKAGVCRYCGGELPGGRLANYCPHCGQNLQVHNCPACGAELEAGWKFCVSCGKGVA